MYLSHIKDVIGSNYIGVDFQRDFVAPFLEELKLYLKDEYDEYTSNQQARDHSGFHITVINVMEYNNLLRNKLVDTTEEINKLFTKNIDDIRYMGVGKASKGGNTAYFIVCQSDKLNQIRINFGLEPRDLHITLGFKHKDVFGVPKNKVLEPTNGFKDKLKEAFMESQDWEFIKEISNWKFDKDSKIYPVELLNSRATFRVDTNDYITLVLINDELYIGAVYQDDKNKPYLATTLVLRYFQGSDQDEN